MSLVCWLAKDACDPLSNVVTSVLYLNGVAVCGSVHLNAVAAVVAVRSACTLGSRVIYLSNCCPLPGIFDSIGEIGVCAGIVEPTFACCGLLGLRQTSHVKAFKDTLAHLWPKLHFKKWRTHRILSTWYLEPTELGAILVCPLSP